MNFEDQLRNVNKMMAEYQMKLVNCFDIYRLEYVLGSMVRNMVCAHNEAIDSVDELEHSYKE